RLRGAQGFSDIRPRRGFPRRPSIGREHLPEGQRHSPAPRPFAALPRIDRTTWDRMFPLMSRHATDDQRASWLQEMLLGGTVLVRELHHATRAEADRDDGVGEERCVNVRRNALAGGVVVDDQLIGSVWHQAIAHETRREILGPGREILDSIEPAPGVVIAVSVDLRAPLAEVAPRALVYRREKGIMRDGVQI